MPIPSLNSIVNTAKEIDSFFNVVKDKLLNDPNEASAKLGEVLGELSQILDFVEKETVRYLGVYFLPDKSNLLECRSVLLSLESGYSTIKGYEARGHCHKIKNIYDKYLDHWFSKILDSGEAQQMKSIFHRMNSADGDMIDSIRELTFWLKTESELALNDVDAGLTDAANLRISAARKDVLLLRREIVDALAQLRLLQASFIVSSKTV